MSIFKWESRYVVFKLKDLEKYLPFTIMWDITNIGNFLAVGRKRDGKAPFNALVIEQDWPEFDIARDLIEARVRREQAAGVLAVGQKIHYPGHEIDGSIIKSMATGPIKPCSSCESLREELRVADKIIAERTRVMNAIPPCPTHGNGCVPWALEWIADARSYGPTMRPKPTGERYIIKAQDGLDSHCVEVTKSEHAVRIQTILDQADGIRALAQSQAKVISDAWEAVRGQMREAGIESPDELTLAEAIKKLGYPLQPVPEEDAAVLAMQSDRAELSRMMRSEAESAFKWLEMNANPVGFNLYALAQWLRDTSFVLSNNPPRAQEARRRVLSALLPQSWTSAMHTAWGKHPHDLFGAMSALIAEATKEKS